MSTEDSARGMLGSIVTASFEDGEDYGPLCGLDACECPEHDYPPKPMGTYITVKLDENHPIGLWRVRVTLEKA